MPLLLTGLRSFEGSLSTICTGVVVDLCGSLGPLIQPYADDLMQALFHMIREGSAKDRDVKAAAISCFGDMALSIGAAFQPYMEPTMMALMQASQQQPHLNNEDMIAFTNKLWCSVFEFWNKLRGSVLEAYSGILVGLAEGQSVQAFVPHAPHVLVFLSSLATDRTKDDAVLHKAVALLGDIARELGDVRDVRKELESEFADKLIDEAARSEKTMVQEKAQWAREAIDQKQRSHSTNNNNGGGVNRRRKNQLQLASRGGRRKN